MPGELKLYVKTWCPWCVTAKQYLDANHYRYRELDVERDSEAYSEMIRLSGQRYTPTLVSDDKILADFDTHDLEVFLKRNSIEP